MQYSYFSVIFGFPNKKVHPFRNFLEVLPPPPYTKLKLGKNSGYTRQTLFVGWGEVLGLCELGNAPDMQKCPKTFVHDCSLSTDAPSPHPPPPQKKKQKSGRESIFFGEGHLYTGYVFTHTQNAPVESNTLYRGALTSW